MNWLLRVVINYYLDAQRPLPGWLNRWISANPTRRAVLNDVRAFEERLHEDRDAYVLDPLPSRGEQPVRVGRVESARPQWAMIATCTALAALLLVMLVWQFGASNSRNASRADNTATTPDLRPVLASLSAGEEVYRKIKDGTQDFVIRSGNAFDFFNDIPLLGSDARQSTESENSAAQQAESNSGLTEDGGNPSKGASWRSALRWTKSLTQQESNSEGRSQDPANPPPAR